MSDSQSKQSKITDLFRFSGASQQSKPSASSSSASSSSSATSRKTSSNDAHHPSNTSPFFSSSSQTPASAHSHTAGGGVKRQLENEEQAPEQGMAMQELEAEEDAANDPLAGARLAQEKIIFLTKVCFLFFCTFLSSPLFLFFPPSI